jgi:hypothetical protein
MFSSILANRPQRPTVAFEPTASLSPMTFVVGPLQYTVCPTDAGGQVQLDVLGSIDPSGKNKRLF